MVFTFNLLSQNVKSSYLIGVLESIFITEQVVFTKATEIYLKRCQATLMKPFSESSLKIF